MTADVHVAFRESLRKESGWSSRTGNERERRPSSREAEVSLEPIAHQHLTIAALRSGSDGLSAVAVVRFVSVTFANDEVGEPVEAAPDVSRQRENVETAVVDVRARIASPSAILRLYVAEVACLRARLGRRGVERSLEESVVAVQARSTA